MHQSGYNDSGCKMNITAWLLICCALAAPSSYNTSVLVWVDVPNDVWEHRIALHELPEVQQQGERLMILAYSAVTNPDVIIEGSEEHAPFNRQRLEIEELDAKLGRAEAFDPTAFIRPVSSEPLFDLQGFDMEQMTGMTSRSRFYYLPDVGGVFVFCDTQGRALAPAIVYLERDNDLPILSDLKQLDERLEWEQAKLDRLTEWIE